MKAATIAVLGLIAALSIAAHASAAGKKPDLPDFNDQRLQRILARLVRRLPVESGPKDVTDPFISSQTARFCRLPQREKNAFEAMQEQTIVPASEYDRREQDYRSRCGVRIIASGEPAARIIHAVYNGPPDPKQPTSARINIGSATLVVVVLKRELSAASFGAKAMKIAQSN
jgi:hypothetical protein